MLNSDELKVYLENLGIAVEGTIIEDVSKASGYLVFVTVTRDTNNLQQPTNRKLHAIRNELAQEGTHVEFMLKNSYALDIEAGLRATLLHHHIDAIRNVFFSADKKGAHVWIEPKRKFTEEETVDVTRRSTVYLASLDLNLVTLRTTIDENLPTKFVCLKMIRQMSPIHIESLMAQLVAADFTVPSVDWLLRRIDSIRRSGLLVRLSNGSYVLSLEGLRSLGTTKNRRSPDIARLLALARRNA